MNLEKNKKAMPVGRQGFAPAPECSVYRPSLLNSAQRVGKAAEYENGWLKARKTSALAKGFTLIEMMIAIFIFSLMMIAVTEIFSSSFGGYGNARNIQKDLEDAQFVMGQIAKTLRTSSIVNIGGSSEITVYDYSQNKCVAYQFVSGEIRTDATADDSVPSTSDPVDWCFANFSPDFSAYNKMAAFFVDGRFNSIKSDNTPGSEILGKVTISMKICSNSSCSKDEAVIQTSVSLRDYTKAGI